MARIAIVFHSGGEHTARLAHAVHRGAAAVPGVTAELLRITPSQIDARGRWHDAALSASLQESDGIIFGCPTLMGMVSAPFKAFMEGAPQPWAVQAWKDKFAGGFTNSASLNGDKTNTQIRLLVFAAQMGMLWVPMDDNPGANWSGGSEQDVNRLGAFLGPMSQALADEAVDRSIPPSALVTGERYGERFALIVRRWADGQPYVTPRFRDAATTAAMAAARAPAV
jgi:NAD(P)H dehydrogenase (quinone)